MKKKLPQLESDEQDDDRKELIPAEVVYRVTPQQRAYATKVVMYPNMTRAEVAKSLGISQYKAKQFEDDENVQALIRHFNNSLVQRDAEVAQNQVLHLRSLMFNDMIRRFEEPDLEDLEEGATPAERLAFLKGHAKYASFKDAMDAFKKLNDMAGLSRDEMIEEQDEFVQEVLVRAQRLIQKRKGLDQAYEEFGINRETHFQTIEVDADGRMIGYVDDESDFGETIHEEISIFAKTTKKGNSDD